MTENEISYKIRGAIFKVYNELGPGLLESTYKKTLAYQLQKDGLRIHREVEVPIIYDDVEFDEGYRMDILVEDKVIVELKSVEEMKALHHKQILTYLKLSDKRLGLLVNFNTADISKSIYRKVNNLDETLNEINTTK
jgi:GxxExxY protein